MSQAVKAGLSFAAHSSAGQQVRCVLLSKVQPFCVRDFLLCLSTARPFTPPTTPPTQSVRNTPDVVRLLSLSLFLSLSHSFSPSICVYLFSSFSPTPTCSSPQENGLTKWARSHLQASHYEPRISRAIARALHIFSTRSC